MKKHNHKLVTLLYRKTNNKTGLMEWITLKDKKICSECEQIFLFTEYKGKNEKVI